MPRRPRRPPRHPRAGRPDVSFLIPALRGDNGLDHHWRGRIRARLQAPRPRFLLISPEQPSASRGQIPVVGRFFPAPVAAKVPEVILLFWIVKILTTAGGEVTSDYLKTYGNFQGGGAG